MSAARNRLTAITRTIPLILDIDYSLDVSSPRNSQRSTLRRARGVRWGQDTPAAGAVQWKSSLGSWRFHKAHKSVVSRPLVSAPAAQRNRNWLWVQPVAN